MLFKHQRNQRERSLERKKKWRGKEIVTYKEKMKKEDAVGKIPFQGVG